MVPFFKKKVFIPKIAEKVSMSVACMNEQIESVTGVLCTSRVMETSVHSNSVSGT